MVEQIIVVSNRAGIHARPAAILVHAIKNFKASIYFEKGDNQINAKSIMGILTLDAAYQTKIKITAEGEDEQEAVDTLVRLFQSRFEES